MEENKKKNCHEDPRLEALIGANVKIVLFDGDIMTGRLSKGDAFGYHKDHYRIYGVNERGRYFDCIFRKSHVRKVEVVL